MKITISRQGVQKQSKTGKSYFTQTGVVQLYDRDGNAEEVPRKIEFMCDVPYPVGEYVLSERSFVVGQYDRLELGRMKLEPLTAPRQSPAAATVKP